MALYTKIINGLNGPGNIAVGSWSPSPSPGMQVLFVINLTAGQQAVVSSYPPATGTGFFANFDSNFLHMYQFDTNDLSASQLLVIYGAP